MTDIDATLEDKFDLDFLAKDEEEIEEKIKGTYKVLIVDDDEDVHAATRMVLRNFVLDEKGLDLIHVYSANEAIEVLNRHEDIAVVILDVVMEKKDSGFKVVQYIRDILGNKITRIIMRTGQPGEAPEESVIRDYDINDYKLKTELTKQKLFTTMYSCLRSYRDIMIIKKNKETFEKMVKISENLFHQDSLEEFLNSLFEQLFLFQHNEEDCFFARDSKAQASDGFIYRKEKTEHVIIAASGRYKPYVGKTLEHVSEIDDIRKEIDNIVDADKNVIKIKKGFVFFNKGANGVRNYVYIEAENENYDHQLIELFLNSYSLALDNFNLSQMMNSVQESIMFTLGETIEKHFNENSNHVRRVSAIMYMLGEKARLSKIQCESIRVASVLHDIGKIGIPDGILKKPGRLDKAEFEVIKTHCETGYTILKDTEHDTFSIAAEIAYDHHERYDGSGYPNGISGNDIPYHARMMAIVDVFDALINRRCYKEAVSLEEAITIMKAESGKHFDPEILQLFLDNVEEFYGKVEGLLDL